MNYDLPDSISDVSLMLEPANAKIGEIEAARSEVLLWYYAGSIAFVDGTLVLDRLYFDYSDYHPAARVRQELTPADNSASTVVLIPRSVALLPASVPMETSH